MNFNRASALKNKYNKYDYKTQITTSSYRPSSLHNSDNQKHLRKQSRTKIKKGSTENSQVIHDGAQFYDLRIPLAEVVDNAAKMSMATSENVIQLKTMNQELKSCISQKERELDQLRQTLGTVRTHNSEDKQLKEINKLRNENAKLQQRFDQQAIQMQTLKKQFQSLKDYWSVGRGPLTSMANSNVEESKVSRRAQYAKNYEINAEIPSTPPCQQCSQYREEIEALRDKYGDELRKLQSEISQLREKEVLLEVLEQQVQNKNNCIDYLRNDLEQFERKSSDLLRIVYSLEERLERQHEQRRNWAEMEDPLSSFRKY